MNVAVRLVLLLFAIGAVALGALSSRQRARAAVGDGARYTCPMHPEVTAPAPDRCPICGMPLVRRAPGGQDASEDTSKDTSEDVTVLRPIVYSRAIRAPAWVERPGFLAAHLTRDELASLATEDSRASFVPTAAPGRHGDVTPGSAEVRPVADPPARWDASTWLVHFRCDALPAFAPVGTVGWVTLPARPREALLVPDSAVLGSAEGPYVWAASPAGTFGPRPVAIGRVFSGNAIVTAGLAPGDRVAVATAFFLDAGRRLSPGAEGALAPGP